MRLLRTILFTFIVTLSFNCFSQNRGMIQYNPSYKFEDGIYLSHKDLLNNSPINFESLVTPHFTSSNFFEELESAKEITYYDKYGMLAKINKKDIWGYARNGKPHIYWAGRFNAIPYIGKVSHFVAVVRVYYDHFPGPFYDPYHYHATRHVRYQDQTIQYFIDFETGKILDYNTGNVLFILQRDKELYDEYSNLRKRRQSRLKFYYIRKYNERNPLYLPK